MNEVGTWIAYAGGSAVVALLWLVVIKIALVIYDEHFER